MLCFRKDPVARNSMDKRQGYQIFGRNFFVSQCRKISQANTIVLCFREIPAANKIMDKRGLSRFSVENFLSHNAKNCRKGTLLCCVSEKIRHCKRLWTRKGGIKTICRKFFFLGVPKSFVGENFCAVFQKYSGSGKPLD